MAKKKEQKNVVFRRIGGRIVPISVGVGVVGVAGLEASRRSTVSKSKNFRVTQRKAIFTRATTFKVKQRVGQRFKKVGYASFTNIGKARARVNILGAVGSGASMALMSGLAKSARSQGIETLFGNMTSRRSAELIKARKGKLVSQSMSGRKLVGLSSAFGEITRLHKGKARAIITGIMRLK